MYNNKYEATVFLLQHNADPTLADAVGFENKSEG